MACDAGTPGYIHLREVPDFPVGRIWDEHAVVRICRSLHVGWRGAQQEPCAQPELTNQELTVSLTLSVFDRKHRMVDHTHTISDGGSSSEGFDILCAEGDFSPIECVNAAPIHFGYKDIKRTQFWTQKNPARGEAS